MLAEKTGNGIVFAQRSDSIQESLAYLKYEHLNRKQRLFNSLYIIRQYFREREIARKAEAVFFQSENDAENFLRRVKKCWAHIAVVRNDNRLRQSKPEYAHANRSETCRNLVFIGTLGKRKGVMYFLKAAAQLHKEKLDFSVKIFGPGSEKDRQSAIAFVKKAGLENTVELFGRTANPLEELKRADLLVVPSLFDSYPNIIIESLHCGTPVVASACGGIPDMLHYPDLLFPPANSDAIRDLLRNLILDNSAYLRYRELCESRCGHFDFDWAQAWLDEIGKIPHPYPASFRMHGGHPE